MGEIADDHVAQMAESPYTYWGRWSPRPAWRDQSIACTRCGVQDLIWTQTANGWRLYTQGIQHKCKTEDIHAKAADDFDVAG